MRQCCTDKNGNQKKKYKTQLEAENVAAHRKSEGVILSPYPCENGDGWHLTASNTSVLERPINEMTKEERKLYSQQNRKRNQSKIGSLLDDELIAKIKDEARQNTLPILKKKIEPLQQEFHEKYKSYWKLHRQYRLAKTNEDRAVLRKTLDTKEKEYKVARQKLRTAEREYDSAKRRINK